jgi:hypothetical protein
MRRMEKIMTSEVRELTADELDSVNGGSSPSLLQVAAWMVTAAVAEGVVLPLIRAGWV